MSKQSAKSKAAPAAEQTVAEAIAAVAEQAAAIKRGTGKLKHADITHFRAHALEDGRRVFDCGDAVAARVRTLTLDELYAAAAAHSGLDESELRTRYAKLNRGMQAMNLRNRLRAIA